MDEAGFRLPLGSQHLHFCAIYGIINKSVFSVLPTLHKKRRIAMTDATKKRRRDFRVIIESVVCGLAIAVLLMMLVASLEELLPPSAIPVIVVALGALGALAAFEPLGRLGSKIRALKARMQHT